MAVPSNEPTFWGVDYEVGGDRDLIATLVAMSKRRRRKAPWRR